MAGTLKNNVAAYKKHAYKYIPPTPPKELMDKTSFTIDFINRKFIHVGLDPDNKFNLELIIITSSRHVNISIVLLNRIFGFMGNILSIILDTPDKSNTNVFLEDENTIVTKMVYRGENMMVIESKTKFGCRILLNRSDLLSLQNLEVSIGEAAIRKNEFSRPIIIEQVEKMASFFFSRVHSIDCKEDMISHVQKYDCNIINNTIPHNHYNYNFIPELKLIAYDEIVRCWTVLLEEQIKCDQESQDVLDDISIISSPPSTEHLTRAPLKKRIRPQPVDENDGPTYFNLQYIQEQSPSNVNIAVQSSEDHAVHSSEDAIHSWGAKRKLLL